MRRWFKKKLNHTWYDYDTWDELKNDKIAWNEYLNDRATASEHINFDWSEVLDKVMPIVNNCTCEAIGVIRARDDKKTLYVHSMEISPDDDEVSDSYARGISYELVKKYNSIPGYFLFHTHPSNVSGDPFPSDTDLYTAMHNNFEQAYIAEAVICEYGVIIYYLTDSRFDDILNKGGLLAFYTFCYDLIMAWNSIHSMQKYRLQDKVRLIEQFGVNMIIIPSSDYISDDYFGVFYPKILFDRFTKTKYKLLNIIKKRVKFYENKELELKETKG